MVYEHSNYRSSLKSVLAERVMRNSSYSLRAFAAHLELAPSYLSAILSGSQNLSFEKATIVANKLELSGVEAEYFWQLIQLEKAKSHDASSLSALRKLCHYAR